MLRGLGGERSGPAEWQGLAELIRLGSISPAFRPGHWSSPARAAPQSDLAADLGTERLGSTDALVDDRFSTGQTQHVVRKLHRVPLCQQLPAYPR